MDNVNDIAGVFILSRMRKASSLITLNLNLFVSFSILIFRNISTTFE